MCMDRIGLPLVQDEHVARRTIAQQRTAELLQRSQQAVESDGGSDPGKVFLGVQGGEVVVPSSRADRTDLRQLIEECFVDYSRVIVESSCDGGIDREVPGNAELLERLENRAHPSGVFLFIPGETGQGLQRGQGTAGSIGFDIGEDRTCRIMIVGQRKKLREYLPGADLAQLVDGPEYLDRLCLPADMG